MIRATLQECIDLYDSNIHMRSTAVRGMEQLGEWEVASKYWNKLGYYADAQACDMIVRATQQGNKYRELSKDIYERYERREINNVELHKLLSEAHNIVYCS